MPFPPRLFPRLSGLLAATLALVCASVSPAADVARVENTARLSYSGADGVKRDIASNTVAVDVSRAKRPTTLSFRLLPIGFDPSGEQCETDPHPQFIPAPIDAATLAAAPPLEALDVHQPLIIVLDADNSNRDPLTRETLWIDGTTGRLNFKLPLLETAPDSGVFAGAVPAATDDSNPALAPCSLGLRRGDLLKLNFLEDGYSYGSSAEVLIDPAGYVFDAANGALVDGATVTLVDESGAPARVFGDDGKSAYPASVVTGAAVTDASGRTYPAVPGRYRFPLAAPGHYRLKVDPPSGYSAPTAVPHAQVEALRDATGLPFILVDASYGGALTLADLDPVYADIPVDGAASGSVLLTKTASVRDASPGDFVQYRITGTNRGKGALPATVLEDTLPTGLRYERGSTRGTSEPEVASDARTLRFAFPALGAGETAEISYVVTIAPGAPAGEALNRVHITSGAASNEAAASVRVHPLLFTDAMTIIGRVTEGACNDPPAQRRGIAGVRIVLEDGTFVVTDRDGLYHIEGVRPGTHVVQMDRASIPATHEPVACGVDTRQARNAISRFVEGDGGLLKRVDFQLRPTGKTVTAVDTLPIAVADDAAAAGNRDWLANVTPGIDWVFPEANHNPRAPSLRVVIKHRPDQRVALTVNGEQTDALAFDGTEGDAARGHRDLALVEPPDPCRREPARRTRAER